MSLSQPRRPDYRRPAASLADRTQQLADRQHRCRSGYRTLTEPPIRDRTICAQPPGLPASSPESAGIHEVGIPGSPCVINPDLSDARISAVLAHRSSALAFSGKGSELPILSGQRSAQS